MNRKQKRWLKRILVALVLFFVVFFFDESGLLARAFGPTGSIYAAFALYLIPYLIAGYKVLAEAARGIAQGEVFDENFLMCVATIGAFSMVLFPDTAPHMAEGAAVMLFYQVGELFQSYAVGKSRRSIAQMMDIAPDYATIERDGEAVQVDPNEIAVGSVILVKPGERVPLDGVVTDGTSELDTAALTGEAAPRHVAAGSEIISGCINLTGVLHVRTTKVFGESTVSRILELVENASEKKARMENFITRFARIYTPVVCCSALALAVLPPLLGAGSFSSWLFRALTFLVVSCPCALVISVPLSFFGGIGGASRLGVLIKGSNYLELLSRVDTVVFDKTGTLTNGTFEVVGITPAPDASADDVLAYAAHAEAFSTHPIAASIRAAYQGTLDRQRVSQISEQAGHGISAHIDAHAVLVGNDRLMREHGIDAPVSDATCTVLHVAVDGAYRGSIRIADTPKDDARAAIRALHDCGIKRCIMLTGDREPVARDIADKLGLDEVHAQLLPADKVERVEALLANEHDRKLAFVGDGINDAPVLMRADVGIAMGAMGSDAAIEAADVVLMDDKPANVAKAIRIARKTMRIVWQNIIFALGVKLLILVLAAFGAANMWLAVFGDVGVAMIAILNAMRAMSVRKL